MLNLQFFGAVGTVTGSNYFLSDSSDKGILVDYGLFQGDSEQSERNSSDLGIDIKNILGVVVTRAHLDHSGRLPLLLRLGYFGKIYMTAATKALIDLSLIDAARVAQKDITKDILYLEEDVFQLLRNVVTVDYDTSFEIGDFTITLRDAGHILGSTIVEVIHTKEHKKIVFSGDLGNSPEELVRPTTLIDTAML